MILEMDKVTRRYLAGGPEALRGINLRVGEPQVIGLIGRNGAGKSTLLRMIPPLIHASSGSVRVFGLDPWEHQEAIKLRLGYLADSDIHPVNIRARDLLELCAAVYPTWDQALADRFIKRFDLNISMAIRKLSKGQQRQIGLLAAVCHRPELLILDEPASGLDPVSRRELLNVVIELLADAGSTVLFASHQLTDVERLASRVVIIHQGLVLADQSVDELKQNACRVECDASSISAEQMRSWRDCVAVESVGTRLQATLLCRPDLANQRLREKFGPLAAAADAQAIGLEDLFSAWTRGAE
jgi:ABC-2 type transport system ATP-binding protein